MLFAVQHNARRILTDRNHARREGLLHAANDSPIVAWARSARIDAPYSTVSEILAGLSRDGVRTRISEHAALGRTYVLIEGPEGSDPSAFTQVPPVRWYDAVIVALAIEPQPSDALPLLAEALGGAGAPAGISECATIGTRLIVEFRPDVTPAHLVTRIVDMELRRFGGVRRTELLSPLPGDVIAAIAAQGLQAAEVASDRILEMLLGVERVE